MQIHESRFTSDGLAQASQMKRWQLFHPIHPSKTVTKPEDRDDLLRSGWSDNYIPQMFPRVVYGKDFHETSIAATEPDHENPHAVAGRPGRHRIVKTQNELEDLISRGWLLSMPMPPGHESRDWSSSMAHQQIEWPDEGDPIIANNLVPENEIAELRAKLAAAEAALAVASAPKKVCSGCGQPGHDKRTCPHVREEVGV
jgi:hypothetical protein